MAFDPNLFDHYFSAALRVVGAFPSSLAQTPDHIANQAAQLALEALKTREKLVAGGTIGFSDVVPAQSYPRASAPMGTGISVQVHAPNGSVAPQPAPAPQAYQATVQPPAPAPTYQQAPIGGGIAPGIGVQVRDANGQPVG